MSSGKRWRGNIFFRTHLRQLRSAWQKSTEFTKTELKVLRHLLRGLSYTRIAAEMGCEMSTVKFHVSNMLQKNRAGKQASACAGSQRRQVDCRSYGRMMGFDFLLVQPQAFIESRSRV
ncbi:MAG: response regulator transcription factor [Oscillospiraceae bacterium]